MGHMKNAPLIYTVGMIHFPRVPDFERYINKFMELIRKEYPLDDHYVAQIFNAQVSSDGIKMEPQETKLWQFATVDRKWGIVLNEQAFFLHTSSYHDFANFAKRFKAGIDALIKIDNIKIGWMVAIGIRYVNLVASLEGSHVREYLKTWVLPSKTPHSSLEIIQGMHAVRYKTKCGELRLQALQNPNFTLPPELNSPFILKNGWIRERPANFSIIDIDHYTAWQAPLKFDENIALETLGNLRKTSRIIFDLVGTPSAMKAWEG
jgi:uncharacterized protein (TIGR04255 family)